MSIPLRYAYTPLPGCVEGEIGESQGPSSRASEGPSRTPPRGPPWDPPPGPPKRGSWGPLLGGGQGPPKKGPSGGGLGPPKGALRPPLGTPPGAPKWAKMAILAVLAQKGLFRPEIVKKGLFRRINKAPFFHVHGYPPWIGCFWAVLAKNGPLNPLEGGFGGCI